MIRLVVFDMAGTTVNEDNVVYKTLQAAISYGGYPVSLEVVLAHGGGKEKLQAIRDVLHVLTGEELEERARTIHADFKTRLVNAYENLDVKPVTGAAQVFSGLRAIDVKVALNTGYDRNTAMGLLKKLGWEEGIHIDAVVTASDVEKNRPHPDMVLLAMQKTGIIDPEEVIKVGDSGIDIEEGRNANCLLSIGITGGAQTASQLMEAEPDYIVNHLSEVLDIVNSKNN